jgi:drug/metabolite transporter (DMT)-like permease
MPEATGALGYARIGVSLHLSHGARANPTYEASRFLMSDTLSRPMALLLFAVVVFSWGLTWPAIKAIVAEVPPLWASTIRSGIAAVALLGLLLARGNLIVPQRGDIAVILNIALLHMVAFAALIAIGMQFVPAGRSTVLGYTAPLWVVPGARLFLGERITARRAIGIAAGMTGLAILFNPLAFDWSNESAVLGNGLILIGAFCWAVSILHVRAHKWISTPFQLVFWEVLLATAVLGGLALAFEPMPHIDWNPRLVGLFLFTSVFGVAVAYWAMATVNRSLPAVTTSLGILATPVVGTLCSALALGETIDATLLSAMALILGGIAIGTIDGGGETRLSQAKR